MELALILFTMFYTSKESKPFYVAPLTHIEAPFVAPVQKPKDPRYSETPQTTPAPVTTTPQEFYQYTCPEDQYPIGDGQCHINNDRPGDWEK